MPVSDHRQDLLDADGDLVVGQHRNPGLETLDGSLEFLGRYDAVEIEMNLLHATDQKIQIEPPGLVAGQVRRRQPDNGIETRIGAQRVQVAVGGQQLLFLEPVVHRHLQPIQRFVRVAEKGLAAGDVVHRRGGLEAPLDRLLKGLPGLGVPAELVQGKAIPLSDRAVIGIDLDQLDVQRRGLLPTAVCGVRRCLIELLYRVGRQRRDGDATGESRAKGE